MQSGLGQAFLGLIVLPIAGNACEHITAVFVACKNKMDLAIGVALGSSIQVPPRARLPHVHRWQCFRVLVFQGFRVCLPAEHTGKHATVRRGCAARLIANTFEKTMVSRCCGSFRCMPGLGLPPCPAGTCFAALMLPERACRSPSSCCRSSCWSAGSSASRSPSILTRLRPSC